MRFEPLAATTTLVNFRMRYAITLRNDGDADAAPVRLRVGLFAGTRANPAGIGQWLSTDDGGAHHGTERIVAGGEYRIEGELAAPITALEAIMVEGRALAVPLIAIDARYQNAPGEAPLEGQTAHAYIVGQGDDPQAAKLAPLRFDQGPADFAGLASRDTGISQRA